MFFFFLFNLLGDKIAVVKQVKPAEGGRVNDPDHSFSNSKEKKYQPDINQVNNK